MLKENVEYIKLHIQSQGDSSVGIQGDDTTILIDKKFINGDYGDAPECRDFIRTNISEIFKELFDDNIIFCHFEDECPNCKQLITECECRDEE
jgi:hypothetical protein